MEEDINTNQNWDIFQKDRIEDLLNIYKKLSVSNPEQKLAKVRRSFKKCQLMLLDNQQLNKNNIYFKRFAQEQENKLFHKIVSLKKQYSSSIDAKQIDKEKFKQQMYNNHREIISFLSKQRGTFSCIAKHFFRGQTKQVEQNQPESPAFAFDVQRGLEYGMWAINNQLLFYIFMRDMATGILELQKRAIYHADLKMHNILLFNCSKDQIMNPREMIKILNKIKFKIIDFGYSFFMDGEFLNQTKRIFDLKKRIDLNPQENPFISYTQQ